MQIPAEPSVEFLHCSYPQAYTRVSFVVSISLLVVNHLLRHVIAPSQLLGSHPSFSVFLSQWSLASTQASRGVPSPPSTQSLTEPPLLACCPSAWRVPSPMPVTTQTIRGFQSLVSQAAHRVALSARLATWPAVRTAIFPMLASMPSWSQNCVLCIWFSGSLLFRFLFVVLLWGLILIKSDSKDIQFFCFLLLLA